MQKPFFGREDHPANLWLLFLFHSIFCFFGGRKTFGEKKNLVFSNWFWLLKNIKKLNLWNSRCLGINIFVFYRFWALLRTSALPGSTVWVELPEPSCCALALEHCAKALEEGGWKVCCEVFSVCLFFFFPVVFDNDFKVGWVSNVCSGVFWWFWHDF